MCVCAVPVRLAESKTSRDWTQRYIFWKIIPGNSNVLPWLKAKGLNKTHIVYVHKGNEV